MRLRHISHIRNNVKRNWDITVGIVRAQAAVRRRDNAIQRRREYRLGVISANAKDLSLCRTLNFAT